MRRPNHYVVANARYHWRLGISSSANLIERTLHGVRARLHHHHSRLLDAIECLAGVDHHVHH